MYLKFSKSRFANFGLENFNSSRAQQWNFEGVIIMICGALF